MRTVARAYRFIRHDGDTYVRLGDVLAVLDEIGWDEPLAPRMARMLRSTERRALAASPDLVELTPPRVWRWRRRP